MAEPDKIVKIDGKLTKDQTRDNCVLEQNDGFRLTAIQNKTMSQKGQVLNYNEAQFMIDIRFFPQLRFEEPGATNPEQFKNQMKSQGWTHICSGAIWVENQIKNVMVFGKK